MFVFNEVHLMPDGLLNVLRSFLDSSGVRKDGVDYSKSIFFFLRYVQNRDILKRLYMLNQKQMFYIFTCVLKDDLIHACVDAYCCFTVCIFFKR